MKAVTKIMTGAAGVAALVGMAAPAAAQYPGYYPGYNQGYNQGTNVIGQVLNTILNPYGQQQQFRMNPQTAASQCSAAVQARLSQRGYGNGGYGGGYNPYGGYGNNPYGGYGNTQSSARVLGISRIEQRSSSTLRVRGYASSGMQAGYQGGYGGYQGGYCGYQGGYGGYQGGYGGYNTAQSADLTFRCDIDYRGYVRDIDIHRRR
jgi:hypothetical protein